MSLSANKLSFVEPISPPLRELLARAVLLTQRGNERNQFAFSFTTLFAAFLVPADEPVCRWLDGYVRSQGIDVDAILTSKGLDQAALRLASQAALAPLDDPALPELTSSARHILTAAREIEQALNPDVEMAQTSQVEAVSLKPLEVRHLMGAFIYRAEGHTPDLERWGFRDQPAWSDDFLTAVIATAYPQELEAWVRLSGRPRPLVPSDKPTPLLTRRAELERYTLSAQVAQALVVAGQLAASAKPQAMPLTTSGLLIQILQSVSSAGGDNSFGQLLDHYPQVGPEFLDNLISRYYDHHERWSSYRFPFPPGEAMTTVVADTFRFAADLAARATHAPLVEPRHLLASLLFNPPSAGAELGALTRLKEARVPLERFKTEFVDITVTAFPADDPAVWQALVQIRLLEPGDQLAGYSADDATGETDLLNIDSRVNALASLIATRFTRPPLAVGIFGDWGSGKSFFMERMKRRVDYLSSQSYQLKRHQYDLAFYKNIVQIQFNAWHYVEGELWASLVEHIFANLTLPHQPGKNELLRRQLLDRLALARGQREAATSNQSAAQKDLETAQRQLEAVETANDAKIKKIKAAVSEGNLEAIEFDKVAQQEIKAAVQSLGDQLGVQAHPATADGPNAAIANAQDFYKSLQAFRQTVEQYRRFQPALRTWRGILSLVFWLLLGPAATLLVWWLLAASQSAGLGQLSAGVAVLTAAAGGLSRGLTDLNRLFQERIDQVAEAERLYYAKVREAESRQKQEVLRLQAELDIARKEVQVKQQAVDDVQQQIQALEPGQMLINFIRDRTETNEYRKYLGVTALIRRDFEKLSDQIGNVNQRLGQAPEQTNAGGPAPDMGPDGKRDAAPPAPGVAAAPLAEAVAAIDEDLLINRIILYIDDLDRCPAKLVVQVLQAVHLLLAFPLFIVVVGVDARWVSYALRQEYPDLLSAHPGDDNEAGQEVPQFALRHQATPHDYLEKIFQIPIWLEPIGPSAVQSMLGKLLPRANDGGAVARADQPKLNVPPAASPLATALQPGTTGQTAGGATTPPASPAGNAAVISPVVAVLPASGQPAPADGRRPPPFDPNPGNLDIGSMELAFMKDLALLIGRSPRAVKRFVNTYQLIKAGLPIDVAEVYFTPRGTANVADYQLVLLLLAVVTGLPTLSRDLFYAIQHPERLADRGTPQAIPLPAETPGTLGELSTALLADFSRVPALQPENRRLQTWLEAHLDWQAVGLKTLEYWVDDVARYSFRVDLA